MPITVSSSDKTFKSHILGIAKEMKITENVYGMSQQEDAQFWDKFETYSGLTTKSERSHKKGQVITFADCIKSAEKVWDKAQ